MYILHFRISSQFQPFRSATLFPRPVCFCPQLQNRFTTKCFCHAFQTNVAAFSFFYIPDQLHNLNMSLSNNSHCSICFINDTFVLLSMGTIWPLSSCIKNHTSYKHHIYFLLVNCSFMSKNIFMRISTSL